jgi:ubiquinone/menaquinone biosynthesis C-methylase UbiE
VRQVRKVLVLLGGFGAGLLAIAVLAGRRHAEDARSDGSGRMGDVRGYDIGASLLLGPVHARVARAIGAAAPAGADVLDVGCCPGHLALRVAAQREDLRVTGLDVDPGMVARATRNRDRRAGAPDPQLPAFVVGDVATLPFADATFDLAVSTFSVHHWTDPVRGIQEVHRVLRPRGRALIWDVTGPLRHGHGSRFSLRELALESPFDSTRLVERWGIGPVTLVECHELARADT